FKLNIILSVSHGCSSSILSPRQHQIKGCFTVDIPLKTLPPYIVQAEYCFCSTDQCNQLGDALFEDVPIPLAKQKSRSTVRGTQIIPVVANAAAAATFWANSCPNWVSRSTLLGGFPTVSIPVLHINLSALLLLTSLLIVSHS
ncbi:unnamed protein product, partial [Anisakis simplex]|uniref:Activin_recp domain-containing protein n=1 Tax=Anisakis simplex TaxID=6269 RepID=A0A0M3J0T8_ANISI